MYMIVKRQMKNLQNRAIFNFPVLLVGNVRYPHHIACVRVNRFTATEPPAPAPPR